MGLQRKNICLLLAFVELFSGNACSLQTYGLQDLCDGTLRIESPEFGVQSSVILKPTKSGYYQDNRNCSLVVKPAYTFYGLVVSVRTIDLRPPPGMIDPTDADTLVIRYKDRDYYRNKVYMNENLIPMKQFDPEEKQSFTSTADVTITFNTSAKNYFSTSAVEGFELIITVVEAAPCGANMFRCHSGALCIVLDLKCDGHNHCGDRSDQRDCGDSGGGGSNYDTSDGGVKFAIGLAIVAGILISCFLIWFTFWNKCKGCCEGGGSYGSSNDRRSYRGTYAIGAVTSYPSSGSSSYFGGSAAGGYSASSSTYAGSSAAGCTSAY